MNLPLSLRSGTAVRIDAAPTTRPVGTDRLGAYEVETQAVLAWTDVVCCSD
jgi:hypothetical protein